MEKKVSSFNLDSIFILTMQKRTAKGKLLKMLFCIPISMCEALKVSSYCFVSTFLHQYKGRKWSQGNKIS